MAMNDARESRSSLSERLLEAGFWSGVVISLICLLACFGYLFLFLLQSSQGIESLLSSKLPQDREAVIFAINGRMVTARLALQEEAKTLPAGAVWDSYCLQAGVPVGPTAWLADVKQYESEVLSQRQ